MKSLLVLLAVAIATQAAVPNKIHTHKNAELWKAWKEKFGKEYETYAEELSRFTIWNDNLELVSKHNIEYDLGMHTYNTAMNKFTDLTSQEFGAMYMGNNKKAVHVAPAEEVFVDRSSLPSTVDWRKEGYVTPVKDQGQCGSCWSFSTTGGLEGQHFNATKNLVSLSEQQMVSCDRTNFGCNGGNVATALNFLKRHGSVSESDYPYTARGGVCKQSGLPIAATVARHVKLPQGNEAKLEESTANVGPISVAIDASHYSFQIYKSGVYYEPRCSSLSLDHAVLVVGYGTESGQDYWLVKNSWGTSWGEEGYIKMSRNKDNNCGIATDAIYPECDD